MDNWISVKDKIPEERAGFNTSEDVNICYADNVISTACYSFHSKKWFDYIYKMRDNITHWQPLPAPPII